MLFYTLTFKKPFGHTSLGYLPRLGYKASAGFLASKWVLSACLHSETGGESLPHKDMAEKVRDIGMRKEDKNAP